MTEPDVRSEALASLRDYLMVFPHERAGLETLQALLDAGSEVFLRTTAQGHVTTSAAVLNPDGSRILLIDHKAHRRWIPPGGHYEGDASLWLSARREVVEETGLEALQPHPWTRRRGGLPIDIDSHAIDANPHKGEGVHLHHDFSYLAVASDRLALSAQLSEVHAAAWVPVDELLQSPVARLRTLHRKLAQISAI